MKDIKWVRGVFGIVLAFVVSVGIAFLYVFVRMFMRGAQGLDTGPEAQKAVVMTTAYAVVALVATALGGFLGGRMPARRAEGSYLLNGLLVGVGTVIILVVFAFIQSGTVGWGTLLQAVLAIAGSALGGWVGGRAAQAEEYD
jgi:putative membrane protein (TIGR04086 family)